MTKSVRYFLRDQESSDPKMVYYAIACVLEPSSGWAFSCGAGVFQSTLCHHCPAWCVGHSPSSLSLCSL
jgi:hypothetical protein